MKTPLVKKASHSNSTDWHIREASPKDMHALVELCAAHAQYEGANYQPEGKANQLWNSLFAPVPALRCWVVEQNGQLTGYLTFMRQFSTWDAAFYLYMDCLYLAPEVRGQGIGEKLMRKLALEAIGQGCTTIQWQTPKANVKAIRFYERIGAVALSKARFFWDTSQQSIKAQTSNN